MENELYMYLDKFEMINFKCLVMNVVGGLTGNRAVIQKNSKKSLKLLKVGLDKIGGIKQE